MVRRRLSLPFTEVIEDDEVIADEEINNWKWKSYHEIDVKQNMGNGRCIHNRCAEISKSRAISTKTKPSTK